MQDQNGDIWHKRVGHPSDNILHYITDSFSGIHFKKNNVLNRLGFLLVIAILDLNTCLTSQTLKSGTFRYHLGAWPWILFDHSKFTWISSMKTKAETRITLTRFVTLINTQFNTKIKIIRSDNGSEFCCKEFYDNTQALYIRLVAQRLPNKIPLQKESIDTF